MDSAWVTNSGICSSGLQLHRGTERSLSANVRLLSLTRFYDYQCVQALNAYCDDVASGRRPVASRLEFFVREADGVLGCVEAPLPAHGSLGPLFLAFGLITEEELRRGAGAAELGAMP